ncbi:MAG: glycoside hydrolase family 13 protein, partial [bacterium]
GVGAVWLSPFYVSPQKDGGYDVADYCDVDPLFGNLSDFDELLNKAHALGLKVLIDLVPNHTSDQHAWFQRALASPIGSKERDFYHFRESGDNPPNNWVSMFGGPAWTRLPEGSWYLHLFDASQPDLNWDNPDVRKEFEKILRFWLDRGVDGFRVDQPHAMVKQKGLPDHPYVEEAGAGFIEGRENPPMWFQDEVHEIFRSWRKILDSYGDRAMCGEAYVLPLKEMAKWVRHDEFHQTFNFRFLDAGWSLDSVRAAIDESFEAFDSVGAPSTWVLNNHDVIRHVSRFGGNYGRATASDGIGPNSPQPDNVLGLRKAKGATLFMLGLPGASYLYQGEELGLFEHTTLPDESRQDPTFFRTNGARVGRDGCRVPLPWDNSAPALGFSTGKPWLPQPEGFAQLSRSNQSSEGSTLSFYKDILRLRKEHAMGSGSFEWLETNQYLSFRNQSITVIHNFSSSPIRVEGEVLVCSGQIIDGNLQPNDSVWLKN